MALSRRGAGRFSAQIWPGFVDAMTAMILVLFFVLSIFMIVQFVLRDTITGQGEQLDELSVQVANLADALGLERTRADRQAALVTTLTGEKATRGGARSTTLTGEKDGGRGADRRLRGAGGEPDRPQHRPRRPADRGARPRAPSG